MKLRDEIIRAALKGGAFRAETVPVSEIVFDKSLRKLCESNCCGQYGRNYACPPDCGSPDELIALVKSRTEAVVFQTVSKLEDSFDIEGMTAAGKAHSGLHMKLKNSFPGILSLAAGGCRLCDECAKIKGLPCRRPDDVVFSLEACCINVSELAKSCGMKYINGADTVTYFSAFFPE